MSAPTLPPTNGAPASTAHEPPAGTSPPRASAAPSGSGSSAGEVPITPRSDASADKPEFPQPAYFYTHDGNVSYVPPLDGGEYEDEEGGSLASGSGSGTDKARPRRRWLSPRDDPEAKRGIPVFEPSMEEFADFERYNEAIAPWGAISGIVKVVPPKEWTDALPRLDPKALAGLTIRKPIEQEMRGKVGEYKQYNIEQRKLLSMKDWFEKCQKPAHKAPGPKDASLSERRERATATGLTPTKRKRRTRAEIEADKAAALAAESGGAGPSGEVGESQVEPVTPAQDHGAAASGAAEGNASRSSRSSPEVDLALSRGLDGNHVVEVDTPSSAGFEMLPDPSGSAPAPAEAPALSPLQGASKAIPASASTPNKHQGAGEREVDPFYHDFNPRNSWQPEGTTDADYTPEACKELERKFWRGCGTRRAWYGADLKGSLFTDETKAWNVAHLPNILAKAKRKIDGVNTPYLYFGMWAAAFAWHVEDMDLFSINYIHFGAPKFWYAIPNKKAEQFEGLMERLFAQDSALCKQFLRHKSYNVSPMNLADKLCRPNTLVQKQGEFVITYPRGYHAGFNMGFNCAESLNFLLMDWVDKVRTAQVCNCVKDSVHIDIDVVLAEVAAEKEKQAKKALQEHDRQLRLEKAAGQKRERKQRDSAEKPVKRFKLSNPPPAAESVPLPVVQKAPVAPPCVICPDPSEHQLVEVIGADAALKGRWKGDGPPMVHRACAVAIPETWVDVIEVGGVLYQVVRGLENVIRDRWDYLKCCLCPPSLSATGVKVQCIQAKCFKAYHPSCAEKNPQVFYREEQAFQQFTERLPDGTERTVSLPTTRLNLLCPKHNPEAQRALKLQKEAEHAAALRARMLAMPVPCRVKGRFADGGLAETTLVRVDGKAEEVHCVAKDGSIRSYAWHKLGLELLVEQPQFSPNTLRGWLDRPILSTAADRAQKYAERSGAQMPPVAVYQAGLATAPVTIEPLRTTPRTAFRPW